jgi:hypothetical protein
MVLMLAVSSPTGLRNRAPTARNISVPISQCVSNAAACTQQTLAGSVSIVWDERTIEMSLQILPMKYQQQDHKSLGTFPKTDSPRSHPNAGQYDQPTGRELVLHLMILYGTVILVLGFVWRVFAR